MLSLVHPSSACAPDTACRRRTENVCRLEVWRWTVGAACPAGRAGYGAARRTRFDMARTGQAGGACLAMACPAGRRGGAGRGSARIGTRERSGGGLAGLWRACVGVIREHQTGHVDLPRCATVARRRARAAAAPWDSSAAYGARGWDRPTGSGPGKRRGSQRR